MNTPAHTLSPAADEQASRWAARLDRGGLTPTEQESLDRWLASDPAHRARLSEYCQMGADLELTLPAIYPAGDSAAAVDRALGQQRAHRRAIWLSVGSIAAALVIGFWFAAGRPEQQTIATSPAQRHAVTLADGTRASLNAQTKVEISFARAERRVRLAAGEALFEVAHDSARPFFVETEAGEVRVTGTRFNVRLEPGRRAEVTVLEGSVEVRPADGGAAATHALRPGDQLQLRARQATIVHLSPESLDNVASWRDGTVVFEDTPLADACARFARYHDREVRVASAVAHLRVGGRFSLEDLDGFVAGLGKVLPVSVAREGDTWNIRSR
jgi:transmembrane sensor